MKWTRTGYTLVALAGMATLQPAWAQMQSRFIGRWQLNAAQSKAAPGETQPASLITQIDRVDTTHIHWTTTITDAKGQPDVETFDTPANGQFYSLNGYTMVSTSFNASTLQSTFKDDTGQTDVVTCTLSSNANQMTCAGVVKHTDGSTAQYSDVFDRI